MKITIRFLDGTTDTKDDVNPDHWGTDDNCLFLRTRRDPDTIFYIPLTAIQFFVVEK